MLEVRIDYINFVNRDVFKIYFKMEKEVNDF
jgi:hypothetical protein